MEVISERKRFDELDIMKGIGIMLIVLGHLEPGTYLMRFVYSFHLFLFFACSGFVGKRYEKRTITSVVIQNVKRLLLPYFVWCSLSQIVDVFFGIIDLGQAIKNIMFLDANVGWNAALWFLISLFWADILCAMITKMKRLMQLMIGVLLLLLCVLFAMTKVVLPFGLYTVPIAAVFWLIGYLASTHMLINRLKGLSFISLIGWGAVLLTVNIICGTIFNSVISIYHIQYQDILRTLIAGIAGTLFMFIIAVLFSRTTRAKELLEFYGKRTLTILCTHYFFLRFIGIVTKVLLGHNLWRYTSTIKSLVFTAVVIAAYYPILTWIDMQKDKHTWLKYVV